MGQRTQSAIIIGERSQKTAARAKLDANAYITKPSHAPQVSVKVKAPRAS